MKTTPQLRALLDTLDERPASAHEGQHLDFKEWPSRSVADGVSLAVEMAVCMANGGGGSVVFGVRDDVVGRAGAIAGVPPAVEVARLQRSIYDRTDPHLTVHLDELHVPEGTGRLLVMHVHGGMAPYTDTAGAAKIRVGDACMPLTGTARRDLLIATGQADYTRHTLPGPPEPYLSAGALEALREAAAHERAPEDLVRQDDLGLLAAIGVLRDGALTRAGLLLAGRREALREHLPGWRWTHLRMRSETEYTDRADGNEALPLALARLTDRIDADNPIHTLERGLFHHEYRTWPAIAVREALMNAIGHADLALGGPVLVKQHQDRLEISNPGGLVAGITPNNILRHEPIARNPCLMDALVALRLVNRSNLGVKRMYRALLIEGKAPPIIDDQGGAVRVVFEAGRFSPTFRELVTEEDRAGRTVGLDDLLILRRLLESPDLSTAEAAALTQRTDDELRPILHRAVSRDWLQRTGTGRGTRWALTRALHERLSAPGDPERDGTLDWEAAKAGVLSAMRRRADRGEDPLRNADVRRIARLSRKQALRLLHELIDEGLVVMTGQGRGAHYLLADPPPKK